MISTTVVFRNMYKAAYAAYCAYKRSELPYERAIKGIEDCLNYASEIKYSNKCAVTRSGNIYYQQLLDLYKEVRHD